MRTICSILAVSIPGLLLSIPLSAQTNEIGVFANHASLSSTTASDSSVGLTARQTYNSRTGFGISFNHYFSQSVSLQLTAQDVKANTRLAVSSGGVTSNFNAGSIELRQYDAALQWHFIPSGWMNPYVGAGVARIQNGKMRIPAELTDSGTAAETASLDSKTTWLADAGVDFRVSRNALITLNARYTRYSTGFGATPDDPVQRLKLDPITIAAGLSLRF